MPIAKNRPSSSSSSIVLDKRARGSRTTTKDENENDLKGHLPHLSPYSSPSVAPALCVKQWQAFQAGRQAVAIAIQQVLTPIVATYLTAPYPPKVKALISLQVSPAGVARKPARMPEGDLLDRMRAALQAAGLLVAR